MPKQYVIFAMIAGVLLGYGLYHYVPAPIKLIIIAACIFHVAWKRSKA
ncbi:MAG: hypothetical protein LCH85_22280 [Chloroflexi bacterium]|nr:hypothetical protein [Chloroflexota bacterium]